MPRILTENGFRIVIWPDDHIPAYVHVYKSGRQMRIAIGIPGELPPWIYDEGTMPRHEQVEALRLLDRHQVRCFIEWRSIHGDMER